MGVSDKAELFCCCSLLQTGEGPRLCARGGGPGHPRAPPPPGHLSYSWLVGSSVACAFQRAGAELIHLIKTDLMIETEALFITVDFHTRHDSRLFIYELSSVEMRNVCQFLN